MKSRMTSLQLASIATVAFVSISAFTTPVHAQSNSLGDASTLRKLSLTLKGVPPQPAEYQALKQQPDTAARQAFLKSSIQTYLKSAEYQDRLVFRLSERLQVKPPSLGLSSGLVPSLQSYEKTQLRLDAMTDLFRRLAANNLSWDELLTGKTYRLYSRDEAFGGSSASDVGFMSLFAKDIPFDGGGAFAPDFYSRPKGESAKPYVLKLDEDDVRVAGIVTTARFNARYNTTGINKNRRRAAALFRTFLCDPMIPAISSNGDRTHDFNNVAFDINYEVTEAEIKNALNVSENARHGSDAQCAACHYKLDPMGKTFQSMGVVLHPEPAEGALIFKSAKQSKTVNIPVRGLGELGKAITAQPDYVDCQVSWFWNEFIGKDVRLTSQRKDELSNEFNKVGRRTNDFIAYLVTQPEFREKPKTATEFVTFDQVRPLLQRCDNCHSHMGDVPSFAKLPISMTGSQTDHVSWIAEMTDRVNRPEGARGRMPKDAASWKPEDLELVKKWLAQGARDENGQATAPTASGDAK